MKKIILAPNAFKGSLSATEVAIALEKGLRLADLPATFTVAQWVMGAMEQATCCETT